MCSENKQTKKNNYAQLQITVPVNNLVSVIECKYFLHFNIKNSLLSTNDPVKNNV